MDSSYDIISEEEVQEVRSAFEDGDLCKATERLSESLKEIENAPLNIAITGESGSGKSTLVNAIRGMDDEEVGSARTGVVETTMKPTPYTHPQYPNVTIWDLPGIGTPDFDAASYLQSVEFSRYDFFIILSSERFKQNYIVLAKEIQAMGRKFYFVRSKVDSDLHASKVRRKKTYNEENILNEIRNDCMQSLKDGGITEPQVFLLSCLELEKYDFLEMQNTLEKELLEHKRHIFLTSLPNNSLPVLEKNCEALRKDIYKTDTMAPHVEIDEAEVQEIKFYIQGGDLSGAIEKLKVYLESLENAPLNIAVTGESGTGKSSFVNTFLELSDEDAAPVGVVETTMEPKAYTHPKDKNVKYWDLPGIGTPNFKAEEYLDKFNFAEYDFFIIVASERFRECNLQLARAIQTMKKKFYFVRSKIGQDVDNCQKLKRKSFNEETMLEEIRENCLKCFREGNIANPKVFLLDSYEKGKYDYDVFQETMQRELPLYKRHAFLMSLPTISLSVLKKKREALRQQIWKKASLSCAVAAIPIPGLGMACDITLLVKTMREYQTAFGLDKGSLNKLSQSSNKSLSELKSVIKSPQVIGELNKEIVIKMISKGTMGAVMVGEHLLGSIPLFGSLAAGGLSFGLTYKMLKGFLFESAQDAQRVLIKAWEDEV